MLAFVPAAISELLKRFPSREGFLWVEIFCEFSIKKRRKHILKILHFLSLRCSADFGPSRLVFYIEFERIHLFFDRKATIRPKFQKATIRPK